MKIFTWVSGVIFLLLFTSGAAQHRRPGDSEAETVRSRAGVCRYGNRLECCYGWKRNSKGVCEAQCDDGCKHGECVAHNKCKCFPGYTGNSCRQDLNECGLKPRPCEHRCMNTFGSFICYCLNGFMLMPDGSCANSRTCAVAHCQYGCEEVHGEVRCLCPSPGLQLSADGKTCLDVDECTSGGSRCPFGRECVNTFGSFYCRCRSGFELIFSGGKYSCEDVDECAASTHTCSRHADCVNTRGSYSCSCRPGFRGTGFHCSLTPGVVVKPPLLENSIPEPDLGGAAAVRPQPFDYDGGVYTGPVEKKPVFPPLQEEEEEEELNSRGDVFLTEDFDEELKEIHSAPLRERLVRDCNFDQGACEWVQDSDDDLDWSVKYHEHGGDYYMAVQGPVGNRGDQARIRLLLDDNMRQASFCLSFRYRIQGQNTGVLRVVTDHSIQPLWERRHSQNQSRDWQSENITIDWTHTSPETVVFVVERGASVSGEIALDHVVLVSGSCSDKSLNL